MSKKNQTQSSSSIPTAVKAIFTNVLFFLGVVLVIIGFVRGVNTLVKSIAFEQYPLAPYEETRCFYNGLEPRFVDSDSEPSAATESGSTQRDAEKQECLEQLDQQRSITQVEDVTTSLSIFIAGAFLIFFFRRFILEK